MANSLDPSAFDFDYGDTLSKEELKGEKTIFRRFGPHSSEPSIDIPGGYASTDLNFEEDINLQRKPCITFRYYRVYPSTLALVLMAESLQPTASKADATGGVGS